MTRTRLRLPPVVAFYLQLSIVVFFLAGSSAPTPLYAVYQQMWGFSPITTTVVFGIYAIAVLGALLVVGSLSDYVGRKPVLMLALVAQGATMVVFATASGVADLMIARIAQGLSTGAAVAALGAGMLDLDRAKGTVANAIAPMTGTATGGLLASLLVEYLPAPTHVVYLVLLGVFAVQLCGVALMAESVTAKPGALASLRPKLGVPAGARLPLVRVVPALVAVWAIAGFYASLGPALAKTVAGSQSLLLGGLALFALSGSGSLSVFLLRKAEPRTLLLIGMVSTLVGLSLTLIAVEVSWLWLFFVGTPIAGVGFGGGFQGALRIVLPLAAPHERAGLLSTVYVLCYLSMGLPIVIAGALAVYADLVTATFAYGGAAMLLAALALLGLARTRAA